MALGYQTAIGNLNKVNMKVLYTGTPENSQDSVIVTVDNTNMQIRANIADAHLASKQDKIIYAIVDEKEGILNAIDFDTICGYQYLNGLVFEDNVSGNTFYLNRRKITADGNYIFIGEDLNGLIPVLVINTTTKKYEFSYVNQNLAQADIEFLKQKLCNLETLFDITYDFNNTPRAEVLHDLYSKFEKLNNDIEVKTNQINDLLELKTTLSTAIVDSINTDTTIGTVIKNKVAEEINAFNSDEGQEALRATKIKINGETYSPNKRIITLPNFATKEELNECNFRFKNDLMTTYSIGNITASATNPATIKAAGRTFEEVWNSIFVSAIAPNTIMPDITALFNDSDVEGAVICPKVTFTFDQGKYSFGPANTGVSITELKVNDKIAKIINNRATLTGEEITVPATIEYMVDYHYSDGILPYTNLGEPTEDGKIIGGSFSKTFTANYPNFGTLDILLPEVEITTTPIEIAEAGTDVSPSYTINIINDKTTYPFGSVEDASSSDAGLLFTINKTINDVISDEYTGGTFTFENIKLVDTPQVYTIKASVSYSDSSRTPLSPKGNRVPSKKIIAGTSVETISNYAIPAGYRKLFIGYATISDNAEINNDLIRSLSYSQASGKVINLELPEVNAENCIIIATPKGTLTDLSVLTIGGFEVNIADSFETIDNVKVAGANNFDPIDYDVLVYKPAKLIGAFKINLN